jgi:hypothetical protein
MVANNQTVSPSDSRLLEEMAIPASITEGQTATIRSGPADGLTQWPAEWSM